MLIGGRCRLSSQVWLGPADDDWLWADGGQVDLASHCFSGGCERPCSGGCRPGVIAPGAPAEAAAGLAGCLGSPGASQSRGWTGAAVGSPRPRSGRHAGFRAAWPWSCSSGSVEFGAAVRRQSVALRPGAGGGRGGLPPAGSPPAPCGARRLDPEHRKSAAEWGITSGGRSHVGWHAGPRDLAYKLCATHPSTSANGCNSGSSLCQCVSAPVSGLVAVSNAVNSQFHG